LVGDNCYRHCLSIERIRSNVPAKRLLAVVKDRFRQYGFPLEEDRKIIPEDDSTLFVCSGMQKLKSYFRNPDGGTYGSLQSCVRTNDLELVGDGSHLTSFVMLGNFSFRGVSYEHSVRMWGDILADLGLSRCCEIHVHPSQDWHKALWDGLGYPVRSDEDCVWSDGEIGGYCCEVYHQGLEIGNLVNPLTHSTDVGFGLERLLQVLEGVPRIDETSLFNHDLHPIVRDHARTLEVMRENGIEPGNKGREYVCRRLLRRVMRLSDGLSGFENWIDQEQDLLKKRLASARKAWRRHKDKSATWWWDTFGVFPEELVSFQVE